METLSGSTASAQGDSGYLNKSQPPSPLSLADTLELPRGDARDLSEGTDLAFPDPRTDFPSALQTILPQQQLELPDSK